MEGMRRDLEGHLRDLRVQLVELINRDYADFINLSTNLVGVDKSLHQLRSPLASLADSVKVSSSSSSSSSFPSFPSSFLPLSSSSPSPSLSLHLFHGLIWQGTKANFEEAIVSLESKLEERTEIREKKAILQVFLNILASLKKVEEILYTQTGQSERLADSFLSYLSFLKVHISFVAETLSSRANK